MQGFDDLFEGHFPGHTMQRVRTPDGRYRYSYVSPGIDAAFGLDPDDLVRREAVEHEWIHTEDRQRFVDGLERSARELTVFDEEVRVEVEAGRYLWVRSIGHPRRLADGSVIWDGVALDVNDRHETSEALERAVVQLRRDEASSSRFVAIAERDLRLPFEKLERAMADLGRNRPGRADPTLVVEAVDNALAAFAEFGRGFDATQSLIFPDRGENAGKRSSGKPDPGMTRRQREVLSMICDGASNREIAERLEIGEGTVKLHVTAILKALGAKNRTMAAAIVRQGRSFGSPGTGQVLPLEGDDHTG